MSGHQQELLDLAKEISAAEGISLTAALQIAKQEMSAVADYVQAWDRMVADMSPARPIVYRVSAA
jgi:hypothetical protein